MASERLSNRGQARFLSDLIECNICMTDVPDPCCRDQHFATV